VRISWVWVALGVALLTSCLSFDEVRCPDGRVCPAGSRCGDGRCISPQQLEACADIADGMQCELVGGFGTCRDRVCEPWTCGDGVLDPNEQCEREGNLLGGKTCLDFNSRTPEGLGCNDDCTFNTFDCAACGDGIMQAGEQCDGADFDLDPALTGEIDCRHPDAGFYDPGLVKCSAICTWDVSGCTGRCGDGVVNGVELCDGVAPAGESCLDFGFDGGRLGCSQCGRSFAGCTQLGWRKIPTPNNQFLQAIWGTATDVFIAGGGGTIVRWNGTAFELVPSMTTTPLYGVWGSTANDVFFVGDAGTILHFDGTSVTAMTSTTNQNLRAVWGTGPTNVYAAGAAGTMLHYDGTSWAAVTSGATSELRGIWGSGATDIFAAGSGGTVVHYDGVMWTRMPTIPSTFDVDADLWSVWGTASNDVYAVSRRNEVFHYDGNAWSPAMMVPGSGSQVASTGVVGGLSDDIFTVGSAIWHYDGARWTKLITPAGFQQLRAVWRSPAGDVWAAGAAGYVLRSGGSSWTTATVPGTNAALRSVAATGPSDAWAVGNGGVIRRYDGGAWASVASTTTTTLTSVWAVGTSFAAAVGFSQTIRHYNGASWGTPAISAPAVDLYVVWGAATNNLFGAGADGAIRRFDGASWKADTTSPPSSVFSFALWGSSSTNVFVGGQTLVPNGTVYRFQGTSWTASLDEPSTSYFAGLWGTGPTDVFAVGDAIYHFDGAWRRMTAGRKLRAVSGTGPRNVFAAGDGGTLLHYDGIDWTPLRVLDANGQPTTMDLRGVAATPRSVIVVGGDLANNTGFVQRLSFSVRPSEVSCRDAWDDDGDGMPDCADSDCASDAYCEAGGACVVAQQLTCGMPITGSNLGRTSVRDYYRCSANAELGPDVLYRFDASSTTTVTATLSGFGAANLDLVVVGAMTATSACDPDFACLGASSTSNATESVTFAVTAGQSYYVAVEGRDAGAAGNFTLSLSCP
jgi:hypothetical protein